MSCLQGDLILKNNDDSNLNDDITNQMLVAGDIPTNIWLLGLRLQQNNNGLSPFQLMFSRNFVERSSSELKQTRRKLQSSVLNCRHCDESFTSKISFRIHQRRHTEEARLRGQREGEAPLKKEDNEEEDIEKKSESDSKSGSKRRIGNGRNRLLKRRRLAKLAEKWGPSDNIIDESVQEEVSENAAEAVRNLLRATREERQKRGRYIKVLK